MLYIPPANAGSKPIPSPNELKNKILLRGKTALTNKISPLTGDLTNTITNENNQEDEHEVAPEDKKRSPIDPYFGNLIALPSVKLSNNLYEDIQKRIYFY